MAARRTLALIARKESVGLLPSDSSVLPLNPQVEVAPQRLVASSPEDLLSCEEDVPMEDAVWEIVNNWQTAALSKAFEWLGVNLADAYSYELALVVRDMVKTAWVLERALRASHATELVTDVPQTLPTSAYPHLSFLGLLLRASSRDLGIPIHFLRCPEPKPRRVRPSALFRLYGAISSRRALTLLHSKGVLLAVGPHPDFYRPLARSWHQKGSGTVVVTPLQLLVRASPKDGLFVLSFESLTSKEERREIDRFVAGALMAIDSLEPGGPLTQASFDLSPVLLSYLEDRFRRELPLVASIGMAFGAGLHKCHHMVMMETGSPVSKASALYARLHGLPITVMQHGVIARAFGYLHKEADGVAAWGPADAEWFRETLGDRVRVEATGCPRYDELPENEPRSPRLQGLADAGRTVLLATQPFVQGSVLQSPWAKEEVLQMVLDAARHLPELTFIIKWHPSEAPGNPEVPQGAKVLQFHHANTLALVRRSQAVMTIGSTVALEAMYLRRPIILLGHPDPSNLFDPTSQGAGLRARDAQELRDLILRLLEDDSHRRDVLEGQNGYLKENFAPLDGQAADRVVELLLEG